MSDPEAGSPESPTSKRRGASAGNTNALKHGLSSRQFKKRDVADLDACQLK